MFGFWRTESGISPAVLADLALSSADERNGDRPEFVQRC